MTASKTLYALLLIFSSAIYAQDVTPRLPPASQETERLFQQWVAANDKTYWRDQPANAHLLQNLLAQPDADVCFLDDIDDAQSEGDERWGAVIEALGKLSTQRTYDILVSRLKSDTERWRAVRLIGAFNRPERIDLLLDQLVNAPDYLTRQEAARALWNVNDSKAEPVLIKALFSDQPSDQFDIIRVLGHLNSQAGLDATLKLLPKFEDRYALELLSAFHRKGTVPPLMAILERHWPEAKPHTDWVCENALFQLDYIARVTRDILGPVPDTPEECRDWWARAEPLLTDDLQLKNPPVQQSGSYSKNDFGTSPELLTFQAGLDSATFRVGDPICLTLTIKNPTDHPYDVVLPNIPSGWFPTMAFGIRLKSGAAVLLNLPPSDFYLGSYGGPPPFETVNPGRSFESSTCLQYLLRRNVDLPLPEGEYELTITFDFSKYAGIQPKGIERVHRWVAAPMYFTVHGPPRYDPQELIKLLGVKFGFPFMLSDLSSPQTVRHDRAWQTLFNYGDSRLRPFVEKFEREHPDHKYYFLSAQDLEPYQLSRRDGVIYKAR